MKYLVLPVLFVLGFGSSVFASDYGNRSYGSMGNDSFRTSNGAECSTNRETGRNLSFGTFGKEQEDGRYNQGVYMEYSIKLGKERSRIDCNKLFNLEVERQSLEIERLRAEIEMMKAQQNANPTGDDW